MWSSTLLRSYSEWPYYQTQESKEYLGEQTGMNFLTDMICIVQELRYWRPGRFQKMVLQPGTLLSFPAGHIGCWAHSYMQWMINCVHFSQWSFTHREIMSLERSFISHIFQGRVFMVGKYGVNASSSRTFSCHPGNTVNAVMRIKLEKDQ